MGATSDQRTPHVRMHVAVVLALVFAASGCDWATFHFGPERSGSNPFESTISAATVEHLRTTWTADTSGAGVHSSPVVANGLAFVSAGHRGPGLFAFSAAGSTGCDGTPRSCRPIWTAAPLCPTASCPAAAAFGDPTVASGTLFVGDTNGVVYALDAATGTRRWTARTDLPGIDASPAVANGVVYISSSNGYLYAFDASGTTNCSGVPTTCAPLWRARTGAPANGSAAPAVVNGIVYASGGDYPAERFYAFDATGSTHCSGAPKTCLPLWSAIVSGRASAPAVVGGVVYLGAAGNDAHGTLYAFDAAGSTGCSGAVRVCVPLWTAVAAGQLVSSPAVAGGVVYIGSRDHHLYAFDAAGSSHCSGTPRTCTPLWSAVTASDVLSSPAVANGLVYVGSDDNRLYAFDAAASSHCTGTPKTCTPLWSFTGTGPIRTGPAVVNGSVYTSSDDGTLSALSLPAP